MLKAFGAGRVFGEEYASAPARVLWLHGWARTHADFSASARELAKAGVSSVAFDLPGFGASLAPEAPGGARDYATWLEAVIDEVTTDPFVLVGHSFGGRIATVYASRHPERVSHLVLTAVPLVRLAPASSPQLSYRIVRWLGAHGLVSQARLDEARQRHGSADYRAASGVMRDVLVRCVNETYEPELTRWPGPTSLLWGKEDNDVPVAVAERARSLLVGDSSLEVLDGVGHLVPTAAPDDLARLVSRCLA